MRLFQPASTRQLDLGLLTLRLVAGTIFAAHGAQKLFVYGVEGVTGAFAGMGVPLAGLVAPATGGLELVGGLALIAGLLVRPVAAALAVVMVGAITLVHLASGFFMPDGYEFVLALLGAGVALSLTGAGGYSLDAMLARRLSAASPSGPRVTRTGDTTGPAPALTR